VLDRPPGKPPSRDQRRARRARKQRAWRQRVRDGQRIAQAPYDDEVIEYLIKWQWLDPAHRHDRREIGSAYFRLVKDAAKD